MYSELSHITNHLSFQSLSPKTSDTAGLKKKHRGRSHDPKDHAKQGKLTRRAISGCFAALTSEVMLLLSVLVLIIMAVRAPSQPVRRADRARDGPALEVPAVIDVALVVALRMADGVADPGVSGDVDDSLRIPNGVTGTTDCQWRRRWPSLMCSKLDNLIIVAYPIHLLHPEGSVVKGHQRDFFHEPPYILLALHPHPREMPKRPTRMKKMPDH
jgi:hypothetical protein